MNTKHATYVDTFPGADPYSLLSKPIQRTYTGLQRQMQETNHGSIMIDFVNDEASSSRWSSSGSTSMPFKTLVTGSPEGASQKHHRATLSAPRTGSRSLHQLLAEATLVDKIPTSPHTSATHSPSRSRSQSPPAQELKLKPFRSSPHSTIMFPSLGTVFNDILDERTSPQIGFDGLGCALLPASEYVLTLESECNFHYEFWDGYDESQFYFPVDIVLHLDPACAPLYEYYALAIPSVPKIAVRLTSLALPTRFTRLLPKPRPSVSETDDDDMSEDDPSDLGGRYVYTTSYRGGVLEDSQQQQQQQQQKAAAAAAVGQEDKVRPLATGKEKVKPPEKGVKPAKKKEDKQETRAPAIGIHLASKWKRLRPSGGLSVSVSSSSSEEDQDEHSSETELEEDTPCATSDLSRDKDRRGFVLRAWVPVLLSLFEYKETCTFRVDARVWIENPYTYIRGENGRTRMSRRRWYRADLGRGGGKWEVGDFSEREEEDSQSGMSSVRMVETSRMVTVSHLQSEQEMI